MVMKECPKCGSTDIDNGETHAGRGNEGTNLKYISETNKTMWRAQVCRTKSYVCLSCGYLETYVENLEAFKKKLSK